MINFECIYFRKIFGISEKKKEGIFLFSSPKVCLIYA